MVSTGASSSGTVTTTSNAITLDNDNTYGYCVSGNKMTWTPQTRNPTTTGTVEFQSGSATSTGGVTGSGGKSGTGGAGGASGTGGTTGSGGAAGAGGATG